MSHSDAINTESPTDTIEHEFPFEDLDQFAVVKINNRRYPDHSGVRDVILALSLPDRDSDYRECALWLGQAKARELAGLLLRCADEAERCDRADEWMTAI